MSGATVNATFHRAIQSSFGIIIASAILAIHPTGYLIAFFVFVLTFITELFSAAWKGSVELKHIPDIEGFQNIRDLIIEIQTSLQTKLVSTN